MADSDPPSWEHSSATAGDYIQTGHGSSELSREGNPTNPLRISDTSDDSDSEVRSQTTTPPLGDEPNNTGQYAEQYLPNVTAGSSADLSDRRQRVLPIHSYKDRKRRLTSTGQEARLQRTKSSEANRRTHQTIMPHRSVSMVVPSSRASSSSQGAGASYATAIDITSSPPEAGPSGTHHHNLRRSSSTTVSSLHQPQRVARYYAGSETVPSPQSHTSRTSSATTSISGRNDQYIDPENPHRSASFSRSRTARRQHSAILRESTNEHSVQTGRPRVQSDAVRSRSARYSGIEFPPWQAGTMDENDLRRAMGVDGDDDEYVEPELPQWQPDSAVDFCPICGNEFSFWYRKHHCRKCGRVVCASCSPHRITIPRQFIVRPPELSQQRETPPRPPRQVVDLTGDDPVLLSPVLNPALGGGEEVRLCNPCVPDPNPNPLSYGPLRARGHRSTHSLPSMGSLLPRPADEDEDRDHRGYSPEFFQYPGADEQRRQATAASHDQYSNPNRPRQSSTTSRQPRRRTVSEQDLCPICGRLFPELSDEHPTEAREAHTRDCIENFGAPTRAPQPSVSTAPTTSTRTSTRRGPAPPPLPPPPPAARMLEFTATEKDCIGEEGGVAECTICMEDYEVGESLARLECLCKFHKDCIVGWFAQKMECPVHKYC